jgi:hypothetical protein
VTSPLQYDFAGGPTAQAVEVNDASEVPGALSTLGLQPPRPTIVVVGGAGGLQDADMSRLRPLFDEAIVPVLERYHGAAVDGGTLSGVMRMFGESRLALGASFPLLGVVAGGTVQLPDRPPSPHADAQLEPNHTHFLIVPGDEWGAESPWIAETATVLAGGAPSVTVLINGGDIAYRDVERSVHAGRRVLTISDSGRTADVLAAALAGTAADERAQALAATTLVSSAPVDQPKVLADALAALFDGSESGRRAR